MAPRSRLLGAKRLHALGQSMHLPAVSHPSEYEHAAQDPVSQACAGTIKRYSQASVEDVNYRAQRQLDKALFQQLATCRWIADKRNLLVSGKCGLGKSWL